MITEQALKEAIAEVQGKRDPNRQDCMMLAAFYIIQDRLYPSANNDEIAGYSFSPQSTQNDTTNSRGSDTVDDYGDTEFLETIRGKDTSICWGIMNELMDTLKIVYPRLYHGVMRQLAEL